MIDIHSHIVPGVDDGSQSFNDTISLVSSAEEQGANVIFATPHSSAFLEDSKGVFDTYHRMKTKLGHFFKDVRFYFGAEVLCNQQNMACVLEALASGQIPTMNGTPYVLTEFDHWVEADTVQYCLSALLQAGWIPIVAHVERYDYLTNHMDFIRQLRDQGCLMQLNVYSLESYQENVKRRDWARDLILQEVIDFLGTDMHNSMVRPASITQGMIWLSEHCEALYLDAITWKNANDQLIHGESTR